MYHLLPDGFTLIERVLPGERVLALRELFREAGHGQRSLLQLPEIRALALELAPPGARPVRGIFFDKLPGANWKVPWHQDVTIAVASRQEMPGFRGWSVKDGVPHVQPPVSILENLLAVRVALDDETPSNGPLKVIPGTHLVGRLPKAEVLALAHSRASVECCVPAGGAVLMRPLLIHSSSKAEAPGHRRVIHLEYASVGLPDGLEWAH